MLPEFQGDFIQWLRGFYYTCVTGSQTAAASKMGRNQSAINNHIKCLEELFGTKLFKGNKRNRHLTHEGEYLLEQTNNIFELIKETKDELAKIGASQKEEISIATYPSVVQYFLPRHIASFKKQHSLVNFRFVLCTHDEIMEKVRMAECDFGISIMEDLPSNLEADPLFTSKMILITPNQGPFLIDHRPSIKEIASKPLIITGGRSKTLSYLQHLSEGKGLMFNTIHEAGGFDVIKKLVESGVGISIGYDYAIRRGDKRAFHVQTLGTDFPKRTFAIVRKPNMHASPQLRAFCNFIKVPIPAHSGH